MFNIANSQYPSAPDQQGSNIQELIPTLAKMTGALGGVGGGSSGGASSGNSFMNGFNAAYNQNQSNGVNLSPVLSDVLGQSNFAQLNTLGGLVSPISGGLY